MRQVQKTIAIGVLSWITVTYLSHQASGEFQKTAYESLFQKGEACWQSGDFRNAIQAYEQALTLAGNQKNKRGRLDCLMNLGVLRWNIGQMKESAACHAEAKLASREMRLAEELSACTKRLQIYDLYEAGKAAVAARRYQLSIAKFESAIALAKDLGRPEFEVKCLRQLSLSYFDQEKMTEFLQLNEKALGIARRLKHKGEEAKCLTNIGLYYFNTNRYSRALIDYHDAMMILGDTDYYKGDRAICLNNIALIYLRLGDYGKALRYLKEAVALDSVQKNNMSICIGLNNIGEILRNSAQGETSSKVYSEAIDYFVRAVYESRSVGDKKIEIYSLNNLGLSYVSLADHATALGYFRSALNEAKEAGRTGDIGAIACNIGQAYLQMGENVQAKTSFLRAIDLAVRTNRDEVLWESYFGLGQCFEAEHEAKAALSCYEKAADIIDTISRQLSWDDQKTGFARDKWKVFETWVDLLFQQKQAESQINLDQEILKIIERAKARALAEGLSQKGDPRLPSLDPDGIAARNRLRRSISRTITRLARRGLSREERETLLKNLERIEDEYTILMNRNDANSASRSTCFPSAISINDVQQDLLDSQTAIVEYFLGEKRSFVVLVTKDGATVEPLAPRRAVEDSLKAYLKLLSTPPKGRFQGAKAGRRIYAELFSALDRKLGPQIRNLIVIPDGVLCYLPFETLVRPGGPDGEGAFLIETLRVSYAPSISSLALLARRQAPRHDRWRILAMGDPVYAPDRRDGMTRGKSYGEVLREIYQDNGFDFSPLPFSKKEIQQIAALFPSKLVDIYVGMGAREEVVKSIPLKDYRIIHFACHGFLDENSPQRSALVLSLDEDPEEDGFLQAREIYELQLNADLVVLSACQTGRGRLEHGEGILGLPRMFFYAGARSIISSLWKIGDRSTSTLMGHFYRLLAGGSGEAQALREAKLRMLRSQLAHPFYWAGFILHGDR